MLTSDHPLRVLDYIASHLGPIVISACQQLSNMIGSGSTVSDVMLNIGYAFYPYITRPEQKKSFWKYLVIQRQQLQHEYLQN